MTIVKELNELAKKMTGVNPKATTDAQAMDFIEQHYKGGDTPTPTPQSKFDYIIPKGIRINETGEITDNDIISVLNEIDNNYLDSNDNIKPLLIGCHIKNDEEELVRGFVIITDIKKSSNVIMNFYTNLGARYAVTIDKQYGKWYVISANLG